MKTVRLDDKYTLTQGRILLNGTQAIARLPLMQRQSDAAAGLKTAGFISGYRGSPLGSVDQTLWKMQEHLAAHNVVFQPGINEDMAATAVWGTQQLALSPGAKYQGVFSLWYGKGPGVDRSGDVLKHANAAGSAQFGGVLAVVGDDHACKSSTFPHQSEQALMAAMIPTLHAASVQDILDYGLHGWAMSRFSGCWVALKLTSDVADATTIAEVSPDRVVPVIPDGFSDLNLRWPDIPLQQEERLVRLKLPAAIAYARANKLDRVIFEAPAPRLGLIAPGKAFVDVQQALDELGLSEQDAQNIGLSLYKVAMPWPLEPEGAKAFALRHPALLVVEEKRAVVEPQLCTIMYGETNRPDIIGKSDLSGAPLLPEYGELSVTRLAVIIGQQLLALGAPAFLQDRVDRLIKNEPDKLIDLIERKPHYCSGCPHNTSTVVPNGSRALGGIGCHYMALWMERSTATVSQMGGEGVAWTGIAPFTEEKHVFANLGDGTYHHSGLMAIRAAVAAKVNITYKILYNDAVAMTGGQHVDGPQDVPGITRQVAAEGVMRIVVVTDDTEKYGSSANFAPHVQIRSRDRLADVQTELREVTGVTVLIYDQTCAAEKRRRRKRKEYPDPKRRVVINELVCEGCGDCSTQSNCLSVVAVDTEFGRKRTIDQSSCNKDFSCLKGFCPSFVTLEGAEVKRPEPLTLPNVPDITPPTLGDAPYNILLSGIGGTGIMTLGAILAMAAHLDDKAVTVLDQTGLAQKGGAIYSHVRLAQHAAQIHTVRLASSSAHIVLAGDLVVAAGQTSLSLCSAAQSQILLNTHETITSEFTRDPNSRAPNAALLQRLMKRAQTIDSYDATRLALRLFGDSIASNFIQLGLAWQKGLIPLSRAAIEQAITLNGVSVAENLRAFLAGRVAAVQPAFFAEPTPVFAQTLDEIVSRRIAFLTEYQNATYAQRYAQFVTEAQRIEQEKTPGQTVLSEAIAKNLFRLMAVKDEYEVARLQTDSAFHAGFKTQFTGQYRLQFHLAPPFMGEAKRTFGAWLLPVLRVLAKLKVLRGTALDIFGYTQERKQERQLLADYETLMCDIFSKLTPETHALAVRLATIPEQIRGFGHVKQRNITTAKAEEARLRALFLKS